MGIGRKELDQVAVKKPKLPRLLWKRKPQTQVVKDKKKYRRKGRRVELGD